MLELRLNCENCNKKLLPNAIDAMICTYECTFCETCVTEILHNVCPNCGGNFQPRPIRPKGELLKNPATDKVVHKPVNMEDYIALRNKHVDIPPEER